MYNDIIFSSILHMTLLFIFLSLLFWVIIKNVEEKSLNNELNKTIDTVFSKININPKYFTESQKELLDNFYNTKSITYTNNNEKLLFFNMIIIGVLISCLIGNILIKYFNCNQTLNITEILSENIIILFFVGIIEFLFFKFIASNYVPVLPSDLPQAFGNSLEKNLS